MSSFQHLRMQQNLQQRQIMTFALQQALHILQMPELELKEWVLEEIERNPVLEYAKTFSAPAPQTPQEPLVAAAPKLRDHLLQQAREALANLNDLKIAEYLVHSLDEKGWLSIPLHEIPFDSKLILKVLQTLQTFDPPGIFARNLQESLDLQLRSSTDSIAKSIVDNHFEDLLQGRLRLIQKKIGISTMRLQKALRQIARLQHYPADSFETSPPSIRLPDITIRWTEENWLIQVGSEEIPSIQIRQEYVDMVPSITEKEEKLQLRSWIADARWLQRCLKRRRDLLRKTALFFIQKQRDFLIHDGKAVPVEIQELAEQLDVHTSTAWRAVAGKTIACPRGLFPLKPFFSETAHSDPVKEIIRRLVQTEDRSHPLTDLAIMGKLQQQGIRCARRTISKYRHSLQIHSAAKRKII